METPSFTRWNYKKANWDLFQLATNEMSQAINARSHKVDRTARYITEAILTAAKKTYQEEHGKTIGHSGLMNSKN